MTSLGTGSSNHAGPPSDPVQEDVCRLGHALAARVDDVLDRTVQASEKTERNIDQSTREIFERNGRASTTAVALWLGGGSPEEGRTTAETAFKTYGELAAQRMAPLNLVAKRVLRWRDSVMAVLRDCAAELDASEEALARALAMVQLTIDVTMVRMCQSFESERKRTDDELAQNQQDLAFMATHDTLTGLPNRTLILDRGEQALARARRHGTPVAALFIDIDNFKSINDTLGHDAGDELLQHLTARLDGVVRVTDALGRLGGDEFVVIAEDLSLQAGPELIAERLLEAFTEPVRLTVPRESRLTVTASIGIATGVRASAEELLRDADIAMYQAKRDGKNRFVVFESDMHDAVQDRMKLEIDLHDALARDEFYLVYQPTFDLRDMHPIAVEALIRWRHPQRGTVQPNDFIPLLEETGLVVDVGHWVLQEASRQAAEWRARGRPIGVAVNVSGRQLDADDFVGHVKQALAASQLDPTALTLEITETTLMRNVEATARRLQEIKDLGVRIAIDDFGTGYSSLAHLQRFPVDALKIDRSFISRLTQNAEGMTLIHTLVQLGKALSIETLAEGIEQEQELSMLQSEDCDSGQGYLFARPLEAVDAERFLEEWESSHGHQPVPAAQPS